MGRFSNPSLFQTPPLREVAAQRPEGVGSDGPARHHTPTPLRGEPPQGGGSETSRESSNSL